MTHEATPNPKHDHTGEREVVHTYTPHQTYRALRMKGQKNLHAFHINTCPPEPVDLTG